MNYFYFYGFTSLEEFIWHVKNDIEELDKRRKFYSLIQSYDPYERMV
jgi:hypothetical protein